MADGPPFERFSITDRFESQGRQPGSRYAGWVVYPAVGRLNARITVYCSDE